MHKDEVEINDTIVTKLIREQFLQLTDLPIQRLSTIGTVNTIYRLGNEYCIRLPRLDWAEKALHNEWMVLPNILEGITLNVPKVIEIGKPAVYYPFSWGIYQWIEGGTYDNTLADERETAVELAQFITELHNIEPDTGTPVAGRAPLPELDEITVNTIAECKNDIDTNKALKIWKDLLYTEPWTGKSVLIHADLLKPNLIVSQGKLSAVIDFGSAGAGDPAFDVIPAWAVFTDRTRAMFKNLLNIDEPVWKRAKAYALHQALLIIPYYRETNPAFVNQAKDTVNNIISDTY